MTNIYKLESLLDHFIESDPDRAERWLESTLAKIELRKRLAHRKAVTPLPNTAQQEPRGWQWLDTGVFLKKLPDTADLGAWHPLYTSPPESKPLKFDEQEMLRLCPHFGPSPARDQWIAGYEAAQGIGEKK